MSPARRPAFAAASPEMTLMMPTPASWPLAVATVCALIPSDARPELVTLPVLISWLAMLVAVSLGMANPMPGAAPASGSRAAALGMPITWPDRLTSAPPLLPPLMAAVVWIASVIVVTWLPLLPAAF